MEVSGELHTPTALPPGKEPPREHDFELRAAVLLQGLEPDGIADHHKAVNETTPNDGSNSEFWSSFSSSEERLLNCAGLILNLPLTPHSQCSQHRPHHEHAVAAHENTITYK
jgi:peptidyl-prolyl cis-trans isomerase SDCCAG10